MTPETQKKLWQDVVDFSLLMLEKAKGGEWDVLPTMVDQRQTQLEQFFAQTVPVGMADSVAKGIRTIGEMDAAITRLTLDEKMNASGAMGLLQKRKQASNAYTEHCHSEA